MSVYAWCLWSVAQRHSVEARGKSWAVLSFHLWGFRESKSSLYNRYFCPLSGLPSPNIFICPCGSRSRGEVVQQWVRDSTPGTFTAALWHPTKITAPQTLPGIYLSVSSVLWRPGQVDWEFEASLPRLHSTILLWMNVKTTGRPGACL